MDAKVEAVDATETITDVTITRPLKEVYVICERDASGQKKDQKAIMMQVKKLGYSEGTPADVIILPTQAALLHWNQYRRIMQQIYDPDELNAASKGQSSIQEMTIN